MRKLMFFIVGLGVVFLFSFSKSTNHDCSTYTSNSRHITCGSCHGGSINTDIVIIGGKEDEEIGEEENTNTGNGFTDPRIIQLIVKVPGFITSTAVQINAYDSKANKFTLNGVKPLFTDVQGAQLALTPIRQFNGKKENELTLFWEAPEVFDEPQTIEIQGVFANMDGTENGDYTFYKEVTIYPTSKVIKIEREVSIFPTISSSTITVNGLIDNDEISIFDMSGKLVLQKNKATNNSTLDVSSLPNGGYFATISNENFKQNSRFIVQK